MSKIPTVTATHQQPNLPPMPPPDRDPPYSDDHNHTHLRGNNTDIRTLRLKIPTQYVDTLNLIQLKLRSSLGIHEVTVVRSGPDTNLQLKGTETTLYDAQEKLGRMLVPNIFGKPDTTTHTETSGATPAQPLLPEHGTISTPDKPADAAADATTTPPYHYTYEATKETKE